MCLQNDGKTAHPAKCIKSRIMTEVIDSVISIDTFVQNCFVLKVMLQCVGPHKWNKLCIIIEWGTWHQGEKVGWVWSSMIRI